MNSKEQKEFNLGCKRIMSSLKASQTVNGIAKASIYTIDENGSKWLYSSLTGYLTILIDYEINTTLIRLYDNQTFEKLFEIKFFKAFTDNYQSLSNDFHCIELTRSFIGFKFQYANQAESFFKTVKIFTDDYQNEIYSNKKTSSNPSLYSKKSFGFDVFAVCRKVFKLGKQNSTELKKYLNLSSQSIEICKPHYFYLLSCFSCDTMTKKFSLTNNLPEDIKEMLNRVGYKKSYLKSDEMSLILFKSFIENFDNTLTKKQSRVSKLIKVEGNNLLDVAAEEEQREIEQMKRLSCALFTRSDRGSLFLFDPRKFESGNCNSVNFSTNNCNDVNNNGGSNSSYNTVNNISSNNNNNSNYKNNLNVKDETMKEKPNTNITNTSNTLNTTNTNSSCNTNSNIPVIPNIPKIPISLKIPEIPKVPTCIPIVKIPKLEDISTVNVQTNQENGNNEVNGGNNFIESTLNAIEKINNDNEVKEEFSLHKELMKVKLTKATQDNISATTSLKLENKTLNDVEFALKKQLQDRARQMQSGEKSSDGEENESDDDW